MKTQNVAGTVDPLKKYTMKKIPENIKIGNVSKHELENQQDWLKEDVVNVNRKGAGKFLALKTKTKLDNFKKKADKQHKKDMHDE